MFKSVSLSFLTEVKNTKTRSFETGRVEPKIFFLEDETKKDSLRLKIKIWNKKMVERTAKIKIVLKSCL